MKIAVTAASGHLGSAVVHALLQQQNAEDIIAIARTPEKAEHLGVKVYPGDYNNKSHFDTALQGVDAVLLISGMDSPENRIVQHRNVIQAAMAAGVKKFVYSSIIGEARGHDFAPLIASYRQTEKDIQNSGMEWVIGRNGLYIEPDVDYIDNYIKAGKITNSAAEGKCSYTTRYELAFAYAKMLLEEKHKNLIYQLVGEAITQQQLTEYLNMAFDTNLVYESISVADFKADRTAELGDHLGTIVSGIYESIRNGLFHVESDYKKAAGREHISWDDYFRSLKKDRP